MYNLSAKEEKNTTKFRTDNTFYYLETYFKINFCIESNFKYGSINKIIFSPVNRF